jgi:hypothetical protein
VRALRKLEFLTSRNELAIAISKKSQKIDGPYQDVLTWARKLGGAATFMNRINRPRSVNDEFIRESFADNGTTRPETPKLIDLPTLGKPRLPPHPCVSYKNEA